MHIRKFKCQCTHSNEWWLKFWGLSMKSQSVAIQTKAAERNFSFSIVYYAVKDGSNF